MNTNKLEIKRFKDIVAFKTDPSRSGAIAFHAGHLEIAEISENLWQGMANTTLDRAEFLELFSSAEHLAEINEWALQPIEIQNTKANLPLKIQTLTINVTQICNLHCHYCAAGGDGTYGDPVRQISIEKTIPQLKMFMQKLQSGDSFSLIFLGGEPLLYPEAIRGLCLYVLEESKLSGIKPHFTIITNGTLINDSFLKLMEGIYPSINLSLDGDPETNDRVRPQRNGKGSSAQALNGLENLLAHRELWRSISLHAVFNRKNTDVLRAYNFFKKYSVDRMEFTFDVTETDDKTNQLFIENMRMISAQAFSEGGEDELRRIAYYDNVFESLDQQIRRTSHCGSGKSLLSLSSKQEVFTCPLEVSFPKNSLGNGENIDFEKLSSLAKPLIELNNCQTCWARHICGGGCLFNHKATTGNPHTKHPTYCFRTRSLLIDAIMYYKQCRS